MKKHPPLAPQMLAIAVGLKRVPIHRANINETEHAGEMAELGQARGRQQGRVAARDEGTRGHPGRMKSGKFGTSVGGAEIAPAVRHAIAKEKFAGGERSRIIRRAEDVEALVTAFDQERATANERGNPFLADRGINYEQPAELIGIEADDLAVG